MKMFGDNKVDDVIEGDGYSQGKDTVHVGVPSPVAIVETSGDNAKKGLYIGLPALVLLGAAGYFLWKSGRKKPKAMNGRRRRARKTAKAKR